MIQKAKYKWRTSWRDWLVVATALLVLGSLILIGYGISQNNKLASQNKELAAENAQIAKQVNDHVDCILKASATPPPPGTPASSRKYILQTLSDQCQIKFTDQ